MGRNTAVRRPARPWARTAPRRSRPEARSHPRRATFPRVRNAVRIGDVQDADAEAVEIHRGSPARDRLGPLWPISPAPPRLSVEHSLLLCHPQRDAAGLLSARVGGVVGDRELFAEAFGA